MGSETHGSFWGSIPMPKKSRSVDVLTGIDYFASETSESRWESVLSTVQDAVTEALRQDKRRVPTFLQSTPSYRTNEKDALEEPPKMWATYVEVLLKWEKHKLFLMLLVKLGSLEGTQNRNIFAQKTGFSSRTAHYQPSALVCRYSDLYKMLLPNSPLLGAQVISSQKIFSYFPANRRIACRTKPASFTIEVGSKISDD